MLTVWLASLLEIVVGQEGAVALKRERLMAFCQEQGFFPEPIDFDIGNVPQPLLYLTPYAEIWGREFDEDWHAVITATPEVVRKHVVQVMYADGVQDKFDQWLAGPEATSDQRSEAYYIFTELRMAADAMSD